MPVRARAQRLRRSLMMLGLIALAFIVLGTTLTYSRYRRDLSDARDRLARGSHLIETSCGAIEYSEEGKGKLSQHTLPRRPSTAPGAREDLYRPRSGAAS